MEIKNLKYSPERKLFWFLYNNKPMQAQIIEQNNKKKIYLLPQNNIVTPHQTASLFKPAKKQSQQIDLGCIKSPLSGSVVKLFVQPGQTITQGQTLLTIESMKMENEIRSFFNAVIQTIPIAEGSVVQQSEVLITLIPIASALSNELADKEDLYGKPKHSNVKTQIQDW